MNTKYPDGYKCPVCYTSGFKSLKALIRHCVTRLSMRHRRVIAAALDQP